MIAKLTKYWLLILILLLAFYLRFFKLTTLISPYWEEVALGYDAHSISQTLKDHHGHLLPLVAFESFGDWKPSLYFYAIVPLIKILGLNLWAVRLPSAIAGMTIVLGVYILCQIIWQNKKLSLLAALVTAISPWAILFSRAAWEVNLATALLLWGVISFFYFKQKKLLIFYILSILLLVLSMYCYHATRIIAPLLGLGLVIMAKLNKKQVVLGAGLALLLISPILLNLNNKSTAQRFAETSIFSNLAIIKESNASQAAQPNLLGKIFYHRYVLFSREIIKNYLSHFNINFLFLSGDNNPRHSIQYFGQLYHIELVFLLLGVVCLTHPGIHRGPPSPENRRGAKGVRLFLFFWLLVSLIPASISTASPHALRILPSLPVWMILVAVGINSLGSKKTILITILLVYALELSVFWRFYTRIYPIEWAGEWQYGYQELFSKLKKLDLPATQTIYLTREQGRPAMYYWFYQQIDPKLVQAANSLVKKDQGEFLEFANFKFVNSISEVTVKNSLVISSPTDLPGFIFLDEVKNKSGQTIWEINKYE